MAKKQYFLIVDTETTQNNLVADFGAVICDRKGAIVAQCGVLVNGIYTNPIKNPLFFDSSAPASALWSKDSSDKRYALYQSMVVTGRRMVASVSAINNWLAKALEQYNPTLTAYNLSFDKGKCANTGIDLNIFNSEFCLWGASYTAFAHTKAFRQIVLETHSFNCATSHGNMSFKTNAETMARFVTNNPNLENEPHTALEDVLDYELLILQKLLKSYTLNWLLNDSQAYNWRDVQVKDWFRPI